MTSREEMLARLSREQYEIKPGQAYTIDRFRPEDAFGVARCFHAVYGGAYSRDTVYLPEALIRANTDGSLYSIVARSSGGDVLGHCALYPAPLSSCLYEEGMLVVVPAYRNGAIATQMVRYGLDVLAHEVPAQGIFGKAVCSHIISQQIGADCGFVETALEVDYIPEEAYKKEQSAAGPVSALWMFRMYQDRPHEVFFPETYAAILGFIYAWLPCRRSVQKTGGAFLPDLPSRVQLCFFGLQNVARLYVEQIGSDIAPAIDACEQTARERGSAVMQVYLPLDRPSAPAATEILRRNGYFLGGMLPRWFDGDGLMMQKLHSEPHFDTIRLYSPRAQKLSAFIRNDRARAEKQS